MKELDLLTEISSGPRLEILQLLEEPLKAGQIAKKLNTSIQGISRHLERLAKVNLIDKDSDGRYRWTSIARVSLLQIPFFSFLSNNKMYFQTHDFEGIPEYLIARLGELSNCKLEMGAKAFQMARDSCISAKKILYGASFSSPKELYDIVHENLKQGMEFKMAYGTNSVFPLGFSKYGPRNDCKKFKGKFEEKVVKNVPIVVGVSESHCHLLFRNEKLGHIDSDKIFFGYDEKSIQWCKELFDYYWNMSEIKNHTLREQ